MTKSRRERIRERRRVLGLSQDAAAKLAGLSYHTWYAIESGFRNPSLHTAKAIAKALGTTIEQIFD